MFFHFFQRRELERLRHIQTNIFRFKALVFHPFFHDGFVLHDFHAFLELIERHPRKLFRVQLAQLILVIVMIRRTQDRAAQTALRDERINTFRRLGLHAFRRVKCGEMIFEHMRHRVILIEPR